MGRNPPSSRWDSAIAPHTSLPCVSACSVKCGPARSAVKRHTYGTPVLPSAYGVRSGKATSIGGATGFGAAIGPFGSASSSHAESVGELSHERFAARELVEAHPLVGLVRLRDVTRTAKNGGNVRAMEQRRFAAERNLADG